MIVTRITLFTALLAANVLAGPIFPLDKKPQALNRRAAAPKTSMSNAERLARGLSLKRPEVLFNPSKRGPLLPRASPNAASEGPEQPDGDTYNFVKCTNDYTFLPTENYGTVTASSTPDAEAQCAALAEPVSYNFAVQQIGANTWACGSSGHYPSFYTEAECTGQNFSLYLSDQSP